MTDQTMPLQSVTSGLDRRALLIGGALLASGGIALARQPQLTMPARSTADLAKLIPDRIGEWTYQTSSGLVLPPPDATSDRLYDGLVTKAYAAPGRSTLMLLVAYSNKQDGMLQVHRPEVCYPASGYRLSSTQHVEIPDGLGGSIAANAFAADGVSRTEQVLYWTRVGNHFPTRWVDQRLAVVEENLAGTVPDGILVRISNFDAELGEALPELSDFAATLLQQATRGARRLLIGRET